MPLCGAFLEDDNLIDNGLHYGIDMKDMVIG